MFVATDIDSRSRARFSFASSTNFSISPSVLSLIRLEYTEIISPLSFVNVAVISAMPSIWPSLLHFTIHGILRVGKIYLSFSSAILNFSKGYQVGIAFPFLSFNVGSSITRTLLPSCFMTTHLHGFLDIEMHVSNSLKVFSGIAVVIIKKGTKVQTQTKEYLSG